MVTLTGCESGPLVSPAAETPPEPKACYRGLSDKPVHLIVVLDGDPVLIGLFSYENQPGTMTYGKFWPSTAFPGGKGGPYIRCTLDTLKDGLRRFGSLVDLMRSVLGDEPFVEPPGGWEGDAPFFDDAHVDAELAEYGLATS